MLRFVCGEAKVARGPVETRVFRQKTMHLNAVFSILLFFGESTKCFWCVVSQRGIEVLEAGKLKKKLRSASFLCENTCF